VPLPPTTQIDPIKIFYQNGGNLASQMYVWDGSKPVLWDGQVSFSGTISIGQVSGSLTNNNAAPAANNLGALTAVVSTTALGYTAGRQVLLRVDTTGALVVSATIDTSAIATSANQTNGSQKTQVVNTTGATQAFGAGTTTTTTIRVVLPTDQTSIPITGTVTATVSNGTVSGTLTTNNAVPAANNVGVLPAVVSTTGLGLSEGNQVLLRVDTTGALVTSATISTTGLATSSNQTDGSQKTQVVNTTGNTQAFGAGNTGTTTPRVVIAADQSAIPVTGTVNATITSATVAGTLTNNNAAPAANNVGVLPAICSTTGLGYTDGRQVLLRTDTTGALVTSATISTTGLATSSNQTDGSQKTQVVNTTGNTQAFGAGTTTTTTVRVVLPTDQTSIPVSITTGSAVIGHVITDAGSVVSTVSAVTSITNALPAGTNAIGKLVASTPYSTTSTNTAVTVTTSPAIITGYYIGNSSTTTAAYLQLFNATAGAVTLGSTAPTQSFYIPAGAAANIAGARKSFTTAFAIAATSGRANSTAPALALDVNFDYE